MDPEVQVTSSRGELSRSVEHLFAEQDTTSRRLIVRHPHTWRPPTDLYETEEAFIARIEVAGMRDGFLSVSITERQLTVAGVRQNLGTRGAYHQMEIQYGEFRTQVRLPSNVEEEKVEASYSDGFLTVVMPKRGAHHVRVVLDEPREGLEN